MRSHQKTGNSGNPQQVSHHQRSSQPPLSYDGGTRERSCKRAKSICGKYEEKRTGRKGSHELLQCMFLTETLMTKK
jgi:hypothetical protein